MTSHRDPTANRAIGSASKGTRTLHRKDCWVDGGPRHHGVKGFRCPRCAEQNGDRETDLLVRLDRYAGTTR